MLSRFEVTCFWLTAVLENLRFSPAKLFGGVREKSFKVGFQSLPHIQLVSKFRDDPLSRNLGPKPTNKKVLYENI